MSEIKVDKISPQAGTDLEIGDSGDTVTVPSGATLDISDATLTPPATMPASSGANLTSLPAGNLTGTVADARISTLTASKLSGIVPTANLGTGTANATTFLNGSGAYSEAGGGKILQVVQDTLTSAFTTTASSYADITGLAVTITPSSASSTILVLATINASGTVGQRFGVQLLRGTTPIFVGDTAGNRTPGLFGSQMAASVETQSINAHFVDSPATTSATTYKVQGVAEASHTLYINRTDYTGDFSTVFRTASSIIVMEISS